MENSVLKIKKIDKKYAKNVKDMYKNKKVSLGYCASVAGMTKEEFIQYLSMNGISI